MAVAHPKSWRETGTGAVLKDAHGRTDGALTVRPAGNSARSPAGTAAEPAEPAERARPAEPAEPAEPADARKDTLVLDGHRARVFNYARPAPDGRPAAYVDVQVQDRDGRPLLIHAWVVTGADHDPTLLPEIVNSVYFSPRSRRLP